MGVIGLIAGNGRLPFLFADAARRAGEAVVAIAHHGETDPALAAHVDRVTWVHVGQLERLRRALVAAGVREAVMAGGIGRVRALARARPDLGALWVVASVRSFRDDGLLRAIARYLEQRGVAVVSPARYLAEVVAPKGPLCGGPPTAAQARDVELGLEVARALGVADVGQTVVVKAGHVLAVEAIEGTDEAIRRGARLGGAGVVVVKRAKPTQDERFDLPAVGPRTVEVMGEVGAALLAVEAGRTLLIDAAEMFARAESTGVRVVGV